MIRMDPCHSAAQKKCKEGEGADRVSQPPSVPKAGEPLVEIAEHDIAFASHPLQLRALAVRANVDAENPDFFLGLSDAENQRRCDQTREKGDHACNPDVTR